MFDVLSFLAIRTDRFTASVLAVASSVTLRAVIGPDLSPPARWRRCEIYACRVPFPGMPQNQRL